MQNKSEQHLYEYAIIRYMPCMERGEFVNIGLLMMCKRRRWLKARVDCNMTRIKAIAPAADTSGLSNQCNVFQSISEGRPKDHPIASLPAEERFRWLTAVRSASIMTSRPHPGFTTDLDSTFERLYSELVL